MAAILSRGYELIDIEPPSSHTPCTLFYYSDVVLLQASQPVLA